MHLTLSGFSTLFIKAKPKVAIILMCVWDLCLQKFETLDTFENYELQMRRDTKATLTILGPQAFLYLVTLSSHLTLLWNPIYLGTLRSTLNPLKPQQPGDPTSEPK